MSGVIQQETPEYVRRLGLFREDSHVVDETCLEITNKRLYDLRPIKKLDFTMQVSPTSDVSEWFETHCIDYEYFLTSTCVAWLRMDINKIVHTSPYFGVYVRINDPKHLMLFKLRWF